MLSNDAASLSPTCVKTIRPPALKTSLKVLTEKRPCNRVSDRSSLAACGVLDHSRAALARAVVEVDTSSS